MAASWLISALYLSFCLVGTSKAASFNEEINSGGDYGYYGSSLSDSQVSGYGEEEPRFLFPNFTSGLLQLNSTLLTYGLVAVLGVGAIILVFFYLMSSSNTSSRYGTNNNYDNYDYSNYQQYYRSADSGFDFNNLNIIQWISMMQEIYEKFEYNDIECQKRLICEVMQSPEYFGEASMKVRTGFEYAKYLEFLNLPDDFREVLDEYVDASERAIGTKTCQEYFDCPYSLKDSVKRNFYGNAL